MRRIALTLATLGILCLAAGQAQAHKYHHGRHGHHGHHGRHHRATVVVGRPCWAAPPMVVRVPAYRPVYRPMYHYPYYSAPAYGFYYQRRGLSIGIGF